ncbi:hypothetical protein MMC24_005687 [Lignoscripta atroalba]|nr:hypothetical protein [Lignoscripta atroalba]
MSDTAATKIVIETIDLLEFRLRRLEFYLSGHDSQDILLQAASQGKDGTINTRLERIHVALETLSSKSRVVNDVLNLYQQHPEIFPPTAKKDSQNSLTTSELLSIISSCATLYPTTASRLTSVQDLPIPPAETSALLISLHPRLARVELLQNSLAGELAKLRLRTASCIQRWYEIGVLGSGECWTEWEERVGVVEKTVRREEAAKARESTIA